MPNAYQMHLGPIDAARQACMQSVIDLYGDAVQVDTTGDWIKVAAEYFKRSSTDDIKIESEWVRWCFMCIDPDALWIDSDVTMHSKFKAIPGKPMLAALGPTLSCCITYCNNCQDYFKRVIKRVEPDKSLLSLISQDFGFPIPQKHFTHLGNKL